MDGTSAHRNTVIGKRVGLGAVSVGDGETDVPVGHAIVQTCKQLYIGFELRENSQLFLYALNMRSSHT